jgi:hypothetical protein
MLFVSTYLGVLLQKGSLGELVEKIQNALNRIKLGRYLNAFTSDQN